MNISKVGLDLIKSFEGCVLHAYQDVVGVWTIGYGHTGDVKKGQTLTKSQAEALLRKDLGRYEDGVEKAIHVKLNQHQFDALTSFAYNLGVGALQKSTLAKKLNAGDVIGASKEFVRWNKAGGRVLAGLTRRREAERDLFLKPMPKPKKPAYPGLLRKGSVGSNVKLIQKKLGIVADGAFGSRTENAVFLFQKAHGLSADGLVGKNTWNALF